MTTTLSGSTLFVVGLIAGLITLIWIAWRSRRSTTKSAVAIRRILVFLTAMFLVLFVWIGWKFQPWMPAGRAIHLSNARIGDYDFQVWQRKNAGLTEPFATGLFVRKQGGRWNVFLLDFEDTYRPTITVKKDDSGITVLYGQTKWGYFDQSQAVLHRGSNGVSFHGVLIDSDPPGDWWRELSKAP